MKYIIVSDLGDGYIGERGWFTAKLVNAITFDCMIDVCMYIDQNDIRGFYIDEIDEEDLKYIKDKTDKLKALYNCNDEKLDQIIISKRADIDLEDKIKSVKNSIDDSLDKRDYDNCKRYWKQYEYLLWVKDLYKFWR